MKGDDGPGYQGSAVRDQEVRGGGYVSGCWIATADSRLERDSSCVAAARAFGPEGFVRVGMVGGKAESPHP